MLLFNHNRQPTPLSLYVCTRTRVCNLKHTNTDAHERTRTHERLVDHEQRLSFAVILGSFRGRGGVGTELDQHYVSLSYLHEPKRSPLPAEQNGGDDDGGSGDDGPEKIPGTHSEDGNGEGDGDHRKGNGNRAGKSGPQDHRAAEIAKRFSAWVREQHLAVLRGFGTDSEAEPGPGHVRDHPPEAVLEEGDREQGGGEALPATEERSGEGDMADWGSFEGGGESFDERLEGKEGLVGGGGSSDERGVDGVRWRGRDDDGDGDGAIDGGRGGAESGRREGLGRAVEGQSDRYGEGSRGTIDGSGGSHDSPSSDPLAQLQPQLPARIESTPPLSPSLPSSPSSQSPALPRLPYVENPAFPNPPPPSRSIDGNPIFGGRVQGEGEGEGEEAVERTHTFHAFPPAETVSISCRGEPVDRVPNLKDDPSFVWEADGVG